jgi:hypothetical protein
MRPNQRKHDQAIPWPFARAITAWSQAPLHAPRLRAAYTRRALDDFTRSYLCGGYYGTVLPDEVWEALLQALEVSIL